MRGPNCNGGHNCNATDLASLYSVFPGLLGQCNSATYPTRWTRSDHLTRNVSAARNNEALELGNYWPSPAPLVTLPMVPEVLTKVHSAQFPSFSVLKWRIAMSLIIEKSLSIIHGLCKVADSDYQVSKRSIFTWTLREKWGSTWKKYLSQALLVPV